MAITIKNVGTNAYAYLSSREGARVRQRYIGRADEPAVAAFIRYLDETGCVPERLWRLFWDTDPRTIDIQANSRYIIERILELGDMDAFHWLEKSYPTKKLSETLFTSRTLSERSQTFWRLWLNVGNDA